MDSSRATRRASACSARRASASAALACRGLRGGGLAGVGSGGAALLGPGGSGLTGLGAGGRSFLTAGCLGLAGLLGAGLALLAGDPAGLGLRSLCLEGLLTCRRSPAPGRLASPGTGLPPAQPLEGRLVHPRRDLARADHGVQFVAAQANE